MTDPTEDPPSRLRVRPYTVTRGRTEAAVELGLETMIRSTDGKPTKLAPEKQSIVTLCRQPQSVAEISAHLKLPLQVAKVLVGDLVVDGHVSTNTGSAQSDGRPDLALLERVLDGLQSL
ncbi:MAG: DUF742 domain-containing protein [Actinomycetota bacterium]